MYKDKYLKSKNDYNNLKGGSNSSSSRSLPDQSSQDFSLYRPSNPLPDEFELPPDARLRTITNSGSRGHQSSNSSVWPVSRSSNRSTQPVSLSSNSSTQPLSRSSNSSAWPVSRSSNSSVWPVSQSSNSSASNSSNTDHLWSTILSRPSTTLKMTEEQQRLSDDLNRTRNRIREAERRLERLKQEENVLLYNQQIREGKKISKIKNILDYRLGDTNFKIKGMINDRIKVFEKYPLLNGFDKIPTDIVGINGYAVLFEKKYTEYYPIPPVVAEDYSELKN